MWQKSSLGKLMIVEIIRGIGTFDINTKAATGAFYSCRIRILDCVTTFYLRID